MQAGDRLDDVVERRRADDRSSPGRSQAMSSLVRSGMSIAIDGPSLPAPR